MNHYILTTLLLCVCVDFSFVQTQVTDEIDMLIAEISARRNKVERLLQGNNIARPRKVEDTTATWWPNGEPKLGKVDYKNLSSEFLTAFGLDDLENPDVSGRKIKEKIKEGKIKEKIQEGKLKEKIKGGKIKEKIQEGEIKEKIPEGEIKEKKQEGEIKKIKEGKIKVKTQEGKTQKGKVQKGKINKNLKEGNKYTQGACLKDSHVNRMAECLAKHFKDDRMKDAVVKNYLRDFIHRKNVKAWFYYMYHCFNVELNCKNTVHIVQCYIDAIPM